MLIQSERASERERERERRARCIIIVIIIINIIGESGEGERGRRFCLHEADLICVFLGFERQAGCRGDLRQGRGASEQGCQMRT